MYEMGPGFVLVIEDSMSSFSSLPLMTVSLAMNAVLSLCVHHTRTLEMIKVD